MLGVGSKVIVTVTTALVVISILSGTILYIQRGAKETLTQEIVIEQLEQKLETIKRVEEKLDETDSIVNDADSAYEWLLQRQSNTD